MTANFLKFCTSGADGLASALATGASRIDCAACVCRIYTGSVEGKCKLCFWGSSTTSFPLPSSVSNGEIASFFSHGQKAAPMFEDSDNPSEYSTTVSISYSCSCCLQCSSTVVSIRHLPLDSLTLCEHSAD